MDAAVRELYEETGFVVTPAAIGRPDWARVSAFRCRGRRRVQEEVVVTASTNPFEVWS